MTYYRDQSTSYIRTLQLGLANAPLNIEEFVLNSPIFTLDPNVEPLSHFDMNGLYIGSLILATDRIGISKS